jgi:hypothetical protein
MTLKQIRSHIRSHLVRMMQDKEFLQEHQWTDREINAMINEAYRMFLQDTEILHGSSTVTLTSGVGTLPDDVISIRRVEVNGEPIGRLGVKSYNGALPK